MSSNSTYTPNRLQKAIGNIAGTHLGFKPNPEGGVKPLPETTAEIAEIQKIYPQKKCVEFCFIGSKTIHKAYALLDYWHQEGTDQFQPPLDLKLPNIPQESSWPHTTPKNNSPDLITILQLILLSGAPNAPTLPPLIQQLNQILGSQQNTIKLLQTLAGSGTLDLKILFSIIGIDETKIKNITNTPPIPEIETPTIETPHIPNEIPHQPIPNIPQVEIPTEPLYGAVIPLKGDKTQGYLLLGFIKH
jgi:hypothetical protein